MRKFISGLLAIAAAAFTGCYESGTDADNTSREARISISPAAIGFDADGRTTDGLAFGTYIVTVNPYGKMYSDWHAELVGTDWATLDYHTASPDGAVEKALRITCSANTDYKRTGTLRVTLSKTGESVDFPITQVGLKPDATLTLSTESDIEMMALEPAEVTVTFETNMPASTVTSAQVVVVERREHAAHLFAGFSERLLGGQVLFRNPPLDQPGEHRVAGHLQMGGENSLPFRQCGQLRLRTLQRRMEPPGLGHGVACRGRSSGGCAALQHERRPDGDPRRRDSSDREHHSRMPAMKSVTARTAAASSPPSAQTSTSVPCLSPNARSERMLTALASRAAVRRVILAGASPLINFTSSPAGRACMPFGAVIVTFPVVI